MEPETMEFRVSGLNFSSPIRKAPLKIMCLYSTYQPLIKVNSWGPCRLLLLDTSFAALAFALRVKQAALVVVDK